MTSKNLMLCFLVCLITKICWFVLLFLTNSSRAGSAWIFKRDGDTFTQLGNKLVGTGATSTAQQGYSVAVNKHGTLVAVGAPYDLGFVRSFCISSCVCLSNILIIRLLLQMGSVFMYYFNGTNYNQLGNKIVGSNAIGSADQGWSVALDGLGSQLLFGGPFDNGKYNDVTDDDAMTITCYVKLQEIWGQHGFTAMSQRSPLHQVLHQQDNHL
jgi:hypothetical protein